jgi:hypothetical protein
MSVISQTKSAMLIATIEGERERERWRGKRGKVRGGEREGEEGRERETLHILIFLVVMPCNLVDKHQHFIRNCYLNHSGEDGANRFFEMLVSSLADMLSPKP